MKKTKMYKYYDKKSDKEKITLKEMPLSESSIVYYLIADEGKVLINKETNKKARSIIIPSWNVINWIEQDISY